jgi:hypothetical protein
MPEGRKGKGEGEIDKDRGGETERERERERGRQRDREGEGEDLSSGGSLPYDNSTRAKNMADLGHMGAHPDKQPAQKFLDNCSLKDLQRHSPLLGLDFVTSVSSIQFP